MDSMETVKILKALADANRLHILELLGSGEQCACVLLGNLNAPFLTLPIRSEERIRAFRSMCCSGIWIFLNQHSHTT